MSDIIKLSGPGAHHLTNTTTFYYYSSWPLHEQFQPNDIRNAYPPNTKSTTSVISFHFLSYRHQSPHTFLSRHPLLLKRDSAS